MRIRDWSSDVGSADRSGARAVIVSTAKLAQNLMPAVLRSQASFVIGMEPLRGMQGDVACHLWSDLIAHYPTDIEACAASQAAKRDDLACIIYTSGTGGAPRGVMQHHGAILCNIEGADKLLEIGRAHVRTPVTNAHIVCRLLLEKKKKNTK